MEELDERENCRQFYMETIMQIKKQFVFDDAYFQITQLVKPQNACSNDPPNLRQVCQRFPELKRSCDSSTAEIKWLAMSLIPLKDIGIMII